MPILPVMDLEPSTVADLQRARRVLEAEATRLVGEQRQLDAAAASVTYDLRQVTDRIDRITGLLGDRGDAPSSALCRAVATTAGVLSAATPTR